MTQAYSNPARESDPYALPDIEVFQLTAVEVAAMDEDTVYEFSKRQKYQLCHMNGRIQEAMLEEIVSERGIEGGWFWQSCFPGCLPDGETVGPFATKSEALANAQEGWDDE